MLGTAGWDLDRLGLTGAPHVNVFVGEERHAVIDLTLRYLGLGAPIVVAADEQGRLRASALAEAMDAAQGPAIVCLQAGNLHSGAFDPIAEATQIAHDHGAWVHVDGAFGLWAAVSPVFRQQLAGLETADSWTTDAHKTLNVPYDCGVAIVAKPDVMRAAFGTQTSYLMMADASGPGDPHEKVPELSRRARGVPVWAALRSLGRSGIAASSNGWPLTPARSRKGSRSCPASRCSTTWCSPRSASASATTSAHGKSPAICWPTASPGCPVPAGTTGTCCGSR